MAIKSTQWLPVDTIYKGGPQKLGVCIHHQAGTERNLQSIFNNRNVSAHYNVGDDYANQYVDLADRAWHTGTDFGNTYLIGIEVQNSAVGGDWPVSDATVDNLTQLLVDIAKVMGWKEYQNQDSGRGGYWTVHRNLYPTACPGVYLYARVSAIIAAVNDLLKGKKPVSGQPKENAKNAFGFDYQAHVQTLGWLPETADGTCAGTVGNGFRLEAIRFRNEEKLEIPGILRFGIAMHISGIGWKDFGEVKDGATIGTTGQSRAIEAIAPYIIENTTGKKMMFQVHASGKGWSGTQTVGKCAFALGSIGESRQLEAVRFWLY